MKRSVFNEFGRIRRRHLTLVAAIVLLSGCVLPFGPQAKGEGGPAEPGSSTSGQIAGPTALRAKSPAVDLQMGEERPFNALVVDASGLVVTAGITWLSSNPNVATVNPTSGAVKALANGTATIIASAVGNPGVQTQIEVRVTEPLTVRNITITPSSSRIAPGESVQLAAAVSMADGTINANVKWISSDDTVATVNPTNGMVSALKPGTVTIEAVFAHDTRFKGLSVIRIAEPGQPVPTPRPAVGTNPAATTAPVGGDPGGTVVNTDQKYGKWIQQNLGAGKYALGVDFVDASTGYVVTEQGVVKTTDAGVTWTVLPASPKGGMGVVFDDASHGVVLESYDLYTTADGGATWTTQHWLPSQDSVTRRLRRLNDGFYVLVYDGNAFSPAGNLTFFSPDGAAWVEKRLVGLEGYKIADLRQVGDAQLAATDKGIYRFSPETGGWELVFDAKGSSMGVTDFGRAALSGFAVKGSTVWAYISQVGLLKSTDAGKNWTNMGMIKDGAGNNLHDMYFIDFDGMAFPTDQFGVLAVAGHIMVTVDGGKSWKMETMLGYSRDVEQWTALDFPDASGGFAVTLSGKVFRYVAP